MFRRAFIRFHNSSSTFSPSNKGPIYHYVVCIGDGFYVLFDFGQCPCGEN